jgi:transcriptional regulator with XRE-family HTH domain
VADFDDVTDEIAAALRACRLERGLSQSQVITRMGYSKSALSMLERGTRHPPLGTLLRYAAVLGAEIRITVISPAGNITYRS